MCKWPIDNLSIGPHPVNDRCAYNFCHIIVCQLFIAFLGVSFSLLFSLLLKAILSVWMNQNEYNFIIYRLLVVYKLEVRPIIVARYYTNGRRFAVVNIYPHSLQYIKEQIALLQLTARFNSTQ